MHLIVHAELGWLLAQGLRQRRDRILVTAAGVVADLDGLSLLGGVESYGRYHHVLTHGFVAAAASANAWGSVSRSSRPARTRSGSRFMIGPTYVTRPGCHRPAGGRPGDLTAGHRAGCRPLG